MTAAFADTYYYLALTNKLDDGHERSIRFSRTFRGRFVTTEYILVEVGDAFAGTNRRTVFRTLVDHLRVDPDTSIIPASPQLFERGLILYNNRPDKAWSLTDCLSFTVMRRMKITAALTADHHFTQAGFRILF